MSHNNNAAPLFRSSGQPGYSSKITNDSRHVTARKHERQVHVRFAAASCTVQSPEGLVRAMPGDAILTDADGAQWPVPKARFPEKYRPVPPTIAGQDGPYMSRPVRVLAVQMSEGFAVLLADGQSTLSGKSGDWLVDYGDGHLGVVSRATFASTYEIPG